jgi:hypothetical protein
MHNAPPVVYPVGRFVWGTWLIAGLAILGCAGLAFWQLMTDPSLWQTVWAWTLALASGLGAFAYGPQEESPSGSLVWQGEGWLWRPQAGAEWPVRVQVLLDGGRFIGLVYAPHDASGVQPGPARFAVLHQATMPSFWHGFRCAVYSRPKNAPVSTHQQTSRFDV